MQGIERLEKIVFILRLNKDPNYVNTDIYRLFDKEDLYVAAYEKMISKPGNLTPGSDPLVHWTNVLGSGVRWPPLAIEGVANEPLAIKGVANEPLPACKVIRVNEQRVTFTKYQRPYN